MIKKTSLVIGSNSFLGSVLSRKLVESGEFVEGVYHKNTHNLFNKIEHFPVNTLDKLKDTYNSVYIVSAYVPKKDSEIDEKRLFEVNCQLVKKISSQFPSAKLIYASSVSVYKETSEIISENSSIKPNSAYGLSKLQGEEEVKNHSKYAIVRISSIYGPQMKLDTFLPTIINQALNTREIIIYGSGERKQNYVEVNDVAEYLMAAANDRQNDTFLAVEEMSISNKELAKLVSLNIEKSEIKFVGKDTSPSYHYDNTYTREILNITSNTTIEKGIKNIIEWMKKQ